MWKQKQKPTMDTEFLATEALDFLMTEDDDFIIIKEDGVWNNLTKPLGGVELKG